MIEREKLSNEQKKCDRKSSVASMVENERKKDKKSECIRVSFH